MLASFPGEDVNDVSKSNTSESEVSPLVASPDERANQTSDNHDPINQNDVKDRRPGHAGGEKQVGKQERSGNEPINVADVEDLAVSTTNLRVVANEFDGNASPAKVGSHGEVGDCCDHGDGCRNVVEDTLLAGLGGGESNECNRCSDHDRSHSPVPV